MKRIIFILMIVVLMATFVYAEYTEDLCTGGIASASGEYNPPNWPATGAFDDITGHTTGDGTGWGSRSEDIAWLQYEFGTQKMIRKLTMLSYSNTDPLIINRAPTTFTLEASNTGVFSGEETTLLAVTGISWSHGEKKEWTFENTNSYRYYRIVMTDKEDPFGRGAEYIIDEIEMMEKLPAINGESCSTDPGCVSNNCDIDFDSATKYCHATATSCPNGPGTTQYASGYELCSGNSWYKSCGSGTWGSQQNSPDPTDDYCDAGDGVQSGYDLAATCSSGTSGGFTNPTCISCSPYIAASTSSCKTSCTTDNDCWSGISCIGGSCANLLGTVKDSSGIPIADAKIVILNQGSLMQDLLDNSYVTTSNSTGHWSYYVDSGTYLIVAYDPNNSSRQGSMKPFIVVP